MHGKAIPNYALIMVMVMSYIALIYKFGIHSDMAMNLNLIKYMLLIPMLLCAFYVDLKEQIIPNRLNLLMFEIGFVFVILNGFSNINVAINMILGMLAGGGIFMIITLIGGLIAGKEAMGLGDVKLMGALRTILWTKYRPCYFCNVIFTRCSTKCPINDC